MLQEKREKQQHRIFFRDEIRAEKREDQELPDLIGHAIVADTEAEGWGWTEEISREAIEKALEQKDLDVVTLWNHNRDEPIGRYPETLELKADDVGLLTTTRPVDCRAARDLVARIAGKVVRGMSFGFYLIREELVNKKGRDLPHFIIKEIELFDVSFVTFPFYQSTDAGIAGRSVTKQDFEERLSRHSLKVKDIERDTLERQIARHKTFLNSYPLWSRF